MTVGPLLLVVVSQIIPGFPPTRDRAPAPVPMAVGTMALSGRIVTDDAAATPVRHASVTRRGRLAIAADDGDRRQRPFRIRCACRRQLHADRVAAGIRKVSYGAKRPGRGPGVSIAIVDGTKPPEIVMRLPHGSVITGVVRSSSGAPLPGAGVLSPAQRHHRPAQSAPDTSAAHHRRSQRVSSLRLAAGRLRRASPADEMARFRIRGRARPAAGDVRRDRVGQSHDDGAKTAGGPPPALDTSPDPARPTTYAPVYFPGTTVPDEASVITLGLGEEKNGVDLTMQLVPTARLTGSVIDPRAARRMACLFRCALRKARRPTSSRGLWEAAEASRKAAETSCSTA